MLGQRTITVAVPEDLYRRVARVASTTHRDVVDVILETITAALTPFPVNPQRGAMDAEIVAYEAMHGELVEQFLGQYVAIYQGELIDRDVDPVILHQRLEEHYPGKIVLCRKVQKEATPVLNMRSPRIERRS